MRSASAIAAAITHPTTLSVVPSRPGVLTIVSAILFSDLTLLKHHSIYTPCTKGEAKRGSPQCYRSIYRSRGILYSMSRRLPLVWIAALFCLFLLFVGGIDYASAATCSDADGNEWECSYAPVNATPAPAQTSPCNDPECPLAIPAPDAEKTSPVLLSEECRKLFPNIPSGAMAGDQKILTQEVCDAYLNLLKNHNAIDREGYKTKGITCLNPDFAVGLDKMLKAAPGNIKVYSGWRDYVPTGGGQNSLHKVGLAADILFSKPTGNKYICQAGGVAGGTYLGLNSPDNLYRWVYSNGRSASGNRIDLFNKVNPFLSGECDHVEFLAKVSLTSGPGCGGSGALTGATGGIPQPSPITQGTGDRISSVGYGTPIVGKCYRTPGGALQELQCASSSSGGWLSGLFGSNKTISCYRYLGGKVFTPASCTMSSSGLSSLFGGNSSLSQMMTGMQLGQGLGSSLFGGSGTSNPPPSTPAPSYYNPLIPPPQTPISPARPSGTSAIDQLIATLGSTPATTGSTNTVGTTVTVSSTSVGELEPAPGGSMIVISTISTSTLAGEISVLEGQLNAATSAIAVASSTGSTSAITGALNSIGGALTAIGHFFTNIFTPSAATTP